MFKLLPIALLATFAVADPTVYLIRHGEKVDSGNGLSTQGLERAQCLRTVFGASSSYDIGHIMAETPKSGEFSFLLLWSGCFGGGLQKDWRLMVLQMASANVLTIQSSPWLRTSA